jgi:hypothetical protein
MSDRIHRLLAHPRAHWAAAAMGVLLCLPALFGGLVGDDYLWWVQLQGVGPMGQGLPAVLHMYNFIPGGLPMEVLKGQGMVSWWADPEMSIALLRPASVLTHVLDHALAPRGYLLQHAHSLGWYALSILVTALTYRRIHPRGGALVGLAALLFAVDDAHAMNAAWLANRHALISMVVGGLAFLAHLRWRQSGRSSWLLAAVGTMTLGLFCGEATLGAAAYLVAWQLTLDRGGWGRRLAGIAPYAVLVVAWRLLYNALGYGIKGSGLYLDPGYDPLGFGLALLHRWPQLQAGQWFQLPVDAIMFLPLRFGAALTALAVAGCALLLWYLWPTLRRSAEARFWALGMSLATVPLAAAFAMDRLLAFTGVGAFALLALQAESAGWIGGGEPHLGRPRRWLTGGLLLMNLPLAALLLLGRTATLPVFGEIFRGGADSLPDDPALEEQLIIYVTGHEFPTAYTPLVRTVEGRPVPARVALLAPFNDHHSVLREDADTLTLTMPGGWLRIIVNQLERRADLGFELGELFEMPDFTAEIREVNASRDATTVAFHFERPLEDPSYRWLAWSAHRAVPWTPPAIGETVELPVLDASSFFPPPGPRADR